jgi:hypothetical protein
MMGGNRGEKMEQRGRPADFGLHDAGFDVIPGEAPGRGPESSDFRKPPSG